MESNESQGAPLAASVARRDPEFWMALAALLVSALALLTSLFQASIQRNQERAMVWPHVSAGARYSGEGFAFVAKNKGLGPALVHQMELRIDGQLTPDWTAALDRLLGPKHGYDWDQVSSNDLAGTILGADESRVLFRIPWDARTREVFGSGRRIEASICYCSFLRECWRSTLGLDHQRVEHCPSMTPAP